MPYIYSTLTNDVDYVFHSKGGGDMPVANHSIRINGGTGVMNKSLVTPLGVATEVSDEDAELLKNHPVFKIHESNGFVKIDDKKHDPEKVAGDMSIADGSAPATEQNFVNADGSSKAKPANNKKV